MNPPDTDRRRRPDHLPLERTTIMGMLSYTVGIKPPDETWRKMVAVYDACADAGIDPPRDVENYFAGDRPDDAGVIVEDATLRDCGAVREWTDGDMREGIEVDLTKIPKDITVIRFINSY
jgi:hypothetical protein